MSCLNSQDKLSALETIRNLFQRTFIFKSKNCEKSVEEIIYEKKFKATGIYLEIISCQIHAFYKLTKAKKQPSSSDTDNMIRIFTVAVTIQNTSEICTTEL